MNYHESNKTRVHIQNVIHRRSSTKDETQDGLLVQSGHAKKSKETLDTMDYDLQTIVAGFDPFVNYHTTMSLMSSSPSIVVSEMQLLCL